jgi:hypothetical protein
MCSKVGVDDLRLRQIAHFRAQSVRSLKRDWRQDGKAERLRASAHPRAQVAYTNCRCHEQDDDSSIPCLILYATAEPILSSHNRIDTDVARDLSLFPAPAEGQRTCSESM